GILPFMSDSLCESKPSWRHEALTLLDSINTPYFMQTINLGAAVDSQSLAGGDSKKSMSLRLRS
ncbi:MAG: hypothetical protein ACJ763_07175, partial [Bdellovibrionia bacterium]